MTYTDSILSVYRRASADDIREGMSWYRDTNLIAREAGNVETGAGIIAALSPRLPWSRNVMLARQAFVAPLEGGALRRSIAAANAILSGTHPLDVLGGLKTRSFFDNILMPLSSEAVTVDTHAIKIAGLDRDSVTPRMYREIADAYRSAAYSVNLRPLEIQAITWTTWRRERGGVR